LELLELPPEPKLWLEELKLWLDELVWLELLCDE